PARVEPTEQYREARTEQEREDPPGLLLEQDPDRPGDQVFGPRHLEAKPLVEVDDQHPEQREATQDVEVGEALLIRGRVGHDGASLSDDCFRVRSGADACTEPASSCKRESPIEGPGGAVTKPMDERRRTKPAGPQRARGEAARPAAVSVRAARAPAPARST